MQKKKAKKKPHKYTKAEINEIYEKFWNLYNPDVHQISCLVRSRIERKCYSYRTMQKFIDCIEFFETEYGHESYRLQFAFYNVSGGNDNRDMFLRIFDLKGNAIAFFKVQKKGDKYGHLNIPMFKFCVFARYKKI